MDDLICKQTLFRLVCYLPWNQTPQKNRFILDQWISFIRHRRQIYFVACIFLYFLFGKSVLCATSRLTTTASFCKLSGMAFVSLPECQCAFLHLSLARMGSQTQTPCYAIDLPDCNAVLTNYRITPVCHATAVKFHSLPTLHKAGSTIHNLEL